MHVTYADKSLFMDDELATLLVEYAAALARHHSADSVTVPAIGADGNATEALFLLTEGAALVAEHVTNAFVAPESGRAEEELRSRLAALDDTEVEPDDVGDALDVDRWDG